MLKLKFNYEKAKEFMFDKLPIWLVGIELFCTILMFAFVIALVPTLNGDNIEHIHTTFLVSEGLVPYRDFFQHHNPLMWYLFAPLAGMFKYNATIAEVASLVAFLFFLKSLVYVFRISSEFLTDKTFGLITAAMIAMPGYRLYALDFRPDNFMVCCLTGGIYYYFKYLKEKKTFHLTAGFLWFTVGFLFAQKALFPLFVLGLTGLYFWKTGEIKTKDMLKALGTSFAVLGGFYVYLLYYDMVMLYWRSNYTFNLVLEQGFGLGRIAEYAPYMPMFIWLGFFGAVGAISAKNRYWFIIALLFVCEFVQRRFYFSPYTYYYWFMMYLAILCGVPVLCRFNCRYKGVSLLVAAGLYVMLFDVGRFQYAYIKASKERAYLPDYITRRITPCDYVFNGDGMMYNMFGKDPAYYWQLIGQLDVIGEKVGIKPKPNVSELILKLKPKFVYAKNYFNKFEDETGGMKIVHYVDKEMLEKYYQPSPFTSVLELKPEYDNRRCVKDVVSGKWSFEK